MPARPQPPREPETWLTARDVASQLKIGVTTAYRLPGLTRYKIGGAVRFRQSDLDRWLDDRRDDVIEIPQNLVRY